LILLALLGCSNFAEDLSDPDVFLSQDYALDRPRVLAMRFNPPTLYDGEQVQIEALVVGDAGEVQVEVCGLREDIPVAHAEAACFFNESLVKPIADQVPALWQLPSYEGVDGYAACYAQQSEFSLPVACFATAPVRVRVEGQDDHGGSDVDAAFIPAVIRVGLWAREDIRRLTDRTATLVTSNPAPSVGDEVQLDFSYRLPTTAGGMPEGLFVRWYTTGGTLLNTGITYPTMNLGTRETNNVLRLDNVEPGPLTVIVTYSAWLLGASDFCESLDYNCAVPDMAWRQIVLDVQ